MTTPPTDLRQQPGVCPKCAQAVFDGGCPACQGAGQQPAQPGSGEARSDCEAK